MIDDSNWRLYDSSAKPLTTNVFRYPIDFSNGIGIGAIGDKFGVWRLDGSTIVPPQYNNAQFNSNRIILYQNRGLKTWLLMLDKTGKMLVNAGRYDGISRFYGKYALVSLGDKTGLIDSLGAEIIAPTSLNNDRFNLMDSLNSVNIALFKAASKYEREHWSYQSFTELPIIVNRYEKIVQHPDSLALPNALRNRVWQYLLETQVEKCIDRADVLQIERASAFKTYEVYMDLCDRPEPTNTLKYLFVDSLRISFTLVSDSAAKSIFKNYWQTKTGWQQKQLSDILNLTRDNVIQLNNLIREKLRKLENEEIDCGESTSFIERTRSAFLTHREGISFYFTSENNSGRFDYVPILLKWAELKPFLTPQ